MNKPFILKQWISSVKERALRRKTSQAPDKPSVKKQAPRAPSTVIRQYEKHPCEAYMSLKLKFRDIGRMRGITETLGRDFLTEMPEGAWKSRLGQIAFLHRRIHDDITEENVERLIDRSKNHAENNPDDWDEWDRANLREMETMFENHAPISCDLVEKRARLAYEGRNRHRDALSARNWADGREFLSSVVDMNRQIAEVKSKASGRNTYYESLAAEYMPTIAVSDIDDWFATMEKSIQKMLPKIIERQEKEDRPLDIKDFYPAKAQMWLNRALLEAIGFDFRRGGLYETGHNPVEGGTPDDTRLVIKNVDINNFMDSMKSALHEGGHGIYIQGLPRSTWRYQPVGQDMGAAVHESQALLVEMIISRTRAFFDFLAPRVEGLFHGLHNPVLSAENLYQTKTRVQLSPIRKKADEVTYFLHILHRYRLEKDLIEGKLKVAELPDAWNAQMQDIFGIQPDNIAEGCLQDVHWFVGKFGYFPSYAVGHMLAAQLFDSIRKDIPDSHARISNGDFMPVTNWLRENVHHKGRLLPFDELVRSATGKALTPKPLLNHLEQRYLAI